MVETYVIWELMQFTLLFMTSNYISEAKGCIRQCNITTFHISSLLGHGLLINEQPMSPDYTHGWRKTTDI